MSTERDRYRARAGFSWFLGLLVALPVALILLAYLFAAGSVIVRDADNQVIHVMLRNSGQKISLSRQPLGFFISTVKLEGEAVAVCRNGAEINFGYITTASHVWRAVRAKDCASALTTRE